MQLSTSSASVRAFVALAAAAHFAVVCSASSLRQAGKVARGDAEAALAAELNETHSEERLVGLEDSLRATFTALPKDAEGRLGHMGVRYVLHRLFVQRYGWYIKGLEPGSDSPRVAVEDEWVPSFLQERLERRLAGHGATLRDLAVLAAAIEDLVRKEAVGRLKAVYDMHALSVDTTLSQEQAEQIITTFYVTFLEEGEFSASSPQEAERRKQYFAADYVGWTEALEWLKGTVAGVADSVDTKGELSYDIIERMALDIGEQYYKFNDMECRALKVEMHSIESKKAGRVRLPEFYKKALYSHWQFDEKLDYLRTLGAADETEPVNPLVVLPNYLTARTNCLEATGLYALCCRNECEDLMGHLEKEVAAPEASPERLAELVSAMPSDTVEAPRKLSATLLRRLSEVAASNGGKVPLHGRLFAQWMHHAFPRECPFPHEIGATSAQTPDEWMRMTGQETHDLNKDQLQEQVNADTCAWVPGEGSTPACGEAEDLPWSEAEELLIVGASEASKQQHQQQQGFSATPVETAEQQPSFSTNSGLAAAASTFFWVILVVGHLSKCQDSCRGILDQEPLQGPLALRDDVCRFVQRERVSIAICALSLAGYAIDLLDGAVILLGAIIGVLRVVAQRGMERLHTRNKVLKCCE